ncbi:hypothetical protein ACFLZ5_01475 [Thermodesulfobacteriota bacterium]
MKIALKREGSRKYTKTSYPVRYGCYSEIEYNNFSYQFNLNGEVKHIVGTGPDWPHPAEWLKRTPGNDWLYYSTGNYYSGVVDLFGEYYFPYPAYPTNCLFKENPFARKNVMAALKEMEKMVPFALGQSMKYTGDEQSDVRDFLRLAGKNSTEQMRKKADQFHRILKAQVTVLPPDCRHVDYDVIPVMVSDGCLYNCSFCDVKSGMDLTCRTRDEIIGQLVALREFYGEDLLNYNSLYLGQHDALAAKPDDIIFAAQHAYDVLLIEQSYMLGPKLFLFGSPESFLRMETYFWDSLDRLPFYTYVNIGLESFDDKTLEFLKKPVSSQDISIAFSRMLEINKSYGHIEVTANVLLGEELPSSHIPSLLKQIGNSLEKHVGKGCIYFSPLKGSKKTKEILDLFRDIKHQSRIDAFLYLIQRL